MLLVITVPTAPTEAACPWNCASSCVKAKRVPYEYVLAVKELCPCVPSIAERITEPPKQFSKVTGLPVTSVMRTRRTYGSSP